ncbi:FAD-binding domain-containing protein [Rhizobium glycinendophyticum]|uniref:FAD-binding domain-containing protein n=1 Tax=Rhizobium glycinendophyticum TaxID=2589807 RepID=UPI001FE49AF1|nr:FAD-binding domain-containing protein [Rhizobium glycinendophyticum]
MDNATLGSGHTSPPLTRAAALARLQDFAPRAGMEYARLRNLDMGPGRHKHVSSLSPALRRRLISEREVVSAVVSEHGPGASDKFISEVFWRTYWKGWLEQRPSVWTGYLKALAHEKQRLNHDSGRMTRFSQAANGRSGIDCFDAWATELQETGYLHNWARMQFSSIWIFTLGLPWELGAAHMFAHLVDADPAANTLSWRWVAGLHTKGKAYLADGERIRAMTQGRFSPQGLARRALLPAESIDIPAPSTPRPAALPKKGVSSLLLLTAEDLSLETLPQIDSLSIDAIALLPGDSEADGIALADALARARQKWPDAQVLGAFGAHELRSARDLRCRQIVTGFAPVGPIADRLIALRVDAEREGLPLTEHQRVWDVEAWPYCRKGFFTLKEKIPMLMSLSGDQR